jgi:hypothetical protein
VPLPRDVGLCVIVNALNVIFSEVIYFV